MPAPDEQCREEPDVDAGEAGVVRRDVEAVAASDEQRGGDPKTQNARVLGPPDGTQHEPCGEPPHQDREQGWQCISHYGLTSTRQG